MKDSAAVSVAEPAITPKKKKRTKSRKKPRGIPRFHVILWNDDDHSYEYVMLMLRELFGHSYEKGFQLAKEVDTRGKAVVITTTKEHAEFKRDQIHAYGKDSLIKNCAGSMYASIEAAPSS